VEQQEVEQEKHSLSQNLVEAEERFERYKEAELKKMKKDRRDIDKQLQLAQAQVADTHTHRTHTQTHTHTHTHTHTRMYVRVCAGCRPAGRAR